MTTDKYRYKIYKKYGYDENVIERNLALLQFATGFPLNKELLKHKLPFLHSSQNFLLKDLSKTKKNIILRKIKKQQKENEQTT